MKEVGSPGAPASGSRHRARLKTAGWLILVLGLGSAGLVYWLGTRSVDSQQDLALIGYSRARSRQMSMLYGKSGLLIDDLCESLKRPGTQASLIASLAVLLSSGCFYLARFPENRADAS